MEFLGDYKEIFIDGKKYTIIGIDLVNLCSSFKKEEVSDGVVLYQIGSIVKIKFNKDGTQSMVDCEVTTLIDEIKEIQEIIPECDLS